MKFKEFATDFLIFGIKEARACIFAGSFFVLLFLSHYITFGLYRYDFLFVAAVLLQVILLATKIETWDEFKTIILFHVLGFTLEVFKTNPAIGSWFYPEAGFFKLFNVPLYSGFMYASVGSYIAQAWRVIKIRVENYPPLYVSATIAALIYINFFTHHFFYDFRYLLALAVAILFWNTKIYFTVTKREYWMPLIVGFVLTAFFIWIAENAGTFLGAWKYPDQLTTWTTVSLHKIESWSLLVIISFILIAELKRLKSLL
jgi:uncharacterized membrane protein YoaT (DUF817 family)